MKFYPKGTPVPYTTREGKEAEYPNALGEHMLKTKSGLQMFNRKDYRRSVHSKIRAFTKKGFDQHEVNPPRRGPVLLLTNHQRMLQRKANREELRKAMAKARKAAR